MFPEFFFWIFPGISPEIPSRVYPIVFLEFLPKFYSVFQDSFEGVVIGICNRFPPGKPIYFQGFSLDSFQKSIQKIIQDFLIVLLGDGFPIVSSRIFKRFQVFHAFSLDFHAGFRSLFLLGFLLEVCPIYSHSFSLDSIIDSRFLGNFS